MPEEAAEPTSWFCIASDADDHHGPSLLACIDLAELQNVSRIEWLPATGSLSFYYDIDEQPWEPGHSEFEVTWNPQKPRPQPPVKAFACKSVTTFPGLSYLDIALTTTEQPTDSNLFDSVFGSSPLHQINGWPQPIRALLETPAGSRLLLQLDSNDALNWMWGDIGESRQGDFSKAWCVLQCG